MKATATIRQTQSVNGIIPPRWENGPPICDDSNLPAFDNSSAAMSWREANAPGSHIRRVWICAHCGFTHYEGSPPSPSGESSGNSERSALPENFKPFMRALHDIRQRNTEHDDAELPRRPVEDIPPEKSVVRRQKSKPSRQTRLL